MTAGGAIDEALEVSGLSAIVIWITELLRCEQGGRLEHHHIISYAWQS